MYRDTSSVDYAPHKLLVVGIIWNVAANPLWLHDYVGTSITFDQQTK